MKENRVKTLSVPSEKLLIKFYRKVLNQVLFTQEPSYPTNKIRKMSTETISKLLNMDRTR